MFNRVFLQVLCVLLLASASTARAADTAPHFKAVAFDYFVIFNPDSVVDVAEKVFPGKGRELTRLWRGKQFEYGFLRSITSRHEDFLVVTGDALDYAAAMMKLELTAQARSTLLNAYLTLTPWPDAVAALKKLRAAGVRIITIANFSEHMLRANARHAGIEDLFDVLLSTEENGTYKPDPRAYALGLEKLGLGKQEVVFAAFGGWDAYGAKNFGYPTYWVNRFGLPVERLGVVADRTSTDISGLVDFILRGPRNAEASISDHDLIRAPAHLQVFIGRQQGNQ